MFWGCDYTLLVAPATLKLEFSFPLLCFGFEMFKDCEPLPTPLPNLRGPGLGTLGKV